MCTMDIRSIRRSVENTITMDTRGRILMRKPVRISLTEIYTLVKNVTALYEIDGITARPEKKDRFRYRASIIGVFLVFLDLYRGDFASINVHFSGTIIKSREKVSHATMSLTIEFRCYRFDIEANRMVSLLRGNGDGNKNALSFHLDRNISYRV